MVPNIRKLMIVLLLMMTSAAFADDAPLDSDPTPEWVINRATPTPTGNESDWVVEGVEYLLVDRQHYFDGGNKQRYFRSVLSVARRFGLESGGIISINYDPVENDILLHHIHVIRDGKTIDLTDSLKFTALRRELDLRSGILDGHITLHATIPDLRVGDIVDVAKSYVAKPSLFSDSLYTRLTVEPYYTIRAEYDRVTLPSDHMLNLAGALARPPKITQADGFTSYEWLRTDAKRHDADYSLPDWQDPWGRVEIGTFGTWQDVSANLAQFYQPNTELPDDLEAWVDATLAQHPSKDGRVTAALRLVQDEIRYVGIEIGNSGYIPRPVDLVRSRGYGDCKDKAVMLVSLLTAMDIVADVALVHSVNGRELSKAMAGPYAFDHAIVRVHDDAGDYWLDPTDVLQGGIARNIAVRDFAWALPLVEGGSSLVPVTRTSNSAALQEVTDIYTFSAKPDVAAELTVTTVFRGTRADEERAALERTTVAEKASDYLDYYDGRFPGATVLEPMWIEDDFDANTLTFHERYELPETAFIDEELWDEFWLNPYSIYDEIPALDDDDEQQSALQLNPDFYNKHTVVLNDLPQPLSPPEPLFLSNDFVTFDMKGKAAETPNSLKVSWDLKVNAAVVLADDFDSYRDAFHLIDDHDNWRYDLHWQSQGAQYANKAVFAGITLERLLQLVLTAILGLICIRAFTKGVRNAV